MDYPRTYCDVSAFRAVPDHQEVWAEAGEGGGASGDGGSGKGGKGGGDDSVIVELLNLKDDVPTTDGASATFFFNDLAEASGAAVHTLQHSHCVSVGDLCPEVAAALPSTEMCVAVGRHTVAKFRDEEKSGPRARNKVVVLLANLRLRDVGTDMLVTMYRTVEAGELSSSRAVDAAGEGGGGDTGDETPE